MIWSFPIGTVRGTVVRVHLTFLLFLVWIGGSAFAQAGARAALESVLFVLLLFLCVVLHEFGHVFAARSYGVKTPDITLLPIGGVARLERIPEDPKQELVIALAGPAVNLVIGAILILVLGGILPAGSTDVVDPGTSLLGRLAAANIFLVVFNLIPAFPMDGGRVLRAILAHRMGYARGTQTAATVGQIIAFGLGALGLFGNPILLFIALFVYLGAASEGHIANMRQTSRGLSSADAMITRFETLPTTARVEDAARLLIETTQHDFPIVDGAGRMRGLLTRNDMIRALRDSGPETPVLDVMQRDLPSVRDRSGLEDAMKLMQESDRPAVAVLAADDRLVGLITPENIGELMMLAAARPGAARRTPGRGTPPPAA